MLMLDLFAGLGGASEAMRRRGWEVVTVDNDPRFGCTVTADLGAWRWDGPPPDLIWASPPCEEFTRDALPWITTSGPPSVALVRAARSIIAAARPRWWVVENVRGSLRHLRPILGEFRQRHGPFFLWGSFPPFACRVAPFKEKLSGRQRAERAKVPYKLSEALALACEGGFLF